VKRDIVAMHIAPLVFSEPVPCLENYRKVFAANLATLRRSRGLTSFERSRRAGLNASYVMALERRGKTPSLGTITRLAEALGVSPELLLVDWEESGIPELERLKLLRRRMELKPAVESVSADTEEQTAAMEEVASTAGAFNQLADVLRQMAARFKIK